MEQGILMVVHRMQELIDFQTYLEAKDRSPRTVKGYLWDLRAFFTWLKEQTGCEMQAAEVTTFDVRQYRDALVSDRHKPATVNRRLAALRAFFDWAVEEGHATGNPAADIKQTKRARRVAPKGLSDREVYLLQRQAAERRQLAEKRAGVDETGQQRVSFSVASAMRDEAVIALLLHTGLRLNEAAGLCVRDVILNKRSGKVCVYGKGRGKKYREVPLNREVRKALAAYLEVRPKAESDDESFFLGQRGRLTDKGIQHLINVIAKAADVKVSAHKLRHTFATRLLRSHGVDLVTTAALMGHESVSTTAIYTQPTEADLQSAVDRLAG
jgi:site-specific recombinase XerD